jgi:hypothetical protein
MLAQSDHQDAPIDKSMRLKHKAHGSQQRPAAMHMTKKPHFVGEQAPGPAPTPHHPCSTHGLQLELERRDGRRRERERVVGDLTNKVQGGETDPPQLIAPSRATYKYTTRAEEA